MSKILFYEYLIIKKLQDIFGGPKELQKYIKLSKYLTKDKNQYKIILLSSFISPRFALKLYLLHSLSNYLNKKFKSVLKIKRPFQTFKLKYDREKPGSYSFPSNTIQKSFILYYLILKEIDYLFLIYPILGYITFIKLIRALHYPHDILFSLGLSRIFIQVSGYLPNFLESLASLSNIPKFS